MLPSSFVFYVLSFLCVLLHPCFVVLQQGFPFPRHPLSFNAAPYVEKVPFGEPTFAAFADNSLSEETVVPLHIFQRIEKMLLFVNTQSQGKPKKFVAGRFEARSFPRNGTSALTIAKSIFYANYFVKNEWRAIPRPARLACARKNFSSARRPTPENAPCVHENPKLYSPS